MKLACIARIVVVIAPGLCSSAAAAAAFDALAHDGTYTWRVAATDDAPPWCCMRWSAGRPVAHSCNLDNRHADYSTGDERDTAGGAMQVYARIEDGKARAIRVLATQCPVMSEQRIVDLGDIDVAESLAWLERRVTPAAAVSADALAAIAVHRGSPALQYLRDVADAGPTRELRKDAIFWMSQTRISEAVDDLERFMFEIDDADLRKHAAFSLSQSTASNRADALIRQGRGDRSADVRSQAWFWLAQTDAAAGEPAILKAVADDPDVDVREEAVFALSQLPDARAVDALFAVLHDRELDSDVRKQALFWLVQSDSDQAYDYLDRLLTGAQ